MSSEANKQIVRRYQEIYNSNELESLVEVVSEHLRTPRILAGLPQGLEGANAAHLMMLKAFPDYRTEIDDLIAEGDEVAARITMSGTHHGEFMGVSPTGRRVTFSGMYIARLEQGKIVEHWSEEDGVSLLGQLGVISL